MATSRRSSSTFGLAAKLSERRRWIKAAWAKTGLDDATYRNMLREVAKVDSCTQITGLDVADRVLNHINKSLGRDSTPMYSGKPSRVRPECAELITKVEALLADMKLPWKYGLTILRHQGSDAWTFATAPQMLAVIAALTVEQEKRQLADQVAASMKAAGVSAEQAVLIARAFGCKKPAAWNRDRDVMKSMIVHLNRVAKKGH